MKCQRKSPPCSACLASRSCARFSPTTSIPASASRGMSSAATYFVAATIVTPGPTSARMRASRSAITSGEETEGTLPPGAAAVAAVGEEEVGAARRAEVDALHALDSGRPQRPLGRAGQVEPAVADEIGVEALRHL